VRLILRTNHEINESLFLQKCVDSKDGANITREVPSTARSREVDRRHLATQFDHKVAVLSIDSGRLRRIEAIEKLRQSFLLFLVNTVCPEPGSRPRWHRNFIILADNQRQFFHLWLFRHRLHCYALFHNWKLLRLDGLLHLTDQWTRITETKRVLIFLNQEDKGSVVLLLPLFHHKIHFK